MTNAGSAPDLSRPVFWAGIAGWLGSTLLIDFSSIHQNFNADTFIPVMVSLHQWTPFFWGQDYYGMLIPLLARPFHDPLTNYLVNEGLSFAVSIGGIFLLCRYLAGAAFAPICACVVVALLFGMWPHQAGEYSATQQFPETALGLGLAALLLFEPKRGRRSVAGSSFAVLTMICACWVNWTIPSLLCLIIGSRAMVQVDRTRYARIADAVPQIMLCLVGLGVGFAMMRLASAHTFVRGWLSSDVWIESWNSLAIADAQVWSTGTIRYGLILMIVISMTACLVLSSLREQLRRSWRRSAAAYTAAIVYALLVGTQTYAAFQRFAPRYWFPSNLLVIVGTVLLCVLPWVRSLRQRHLAWASWAAVAVVCLMIVRVHGGPSIDTVRSSLKRNFGTYAADVEAERCTYLMGNYWRVWPGVFYVQMVRAEHGDATPFWAMTFRGDQLKDRWNVRDQKNWRIAVPHEDEGDIARSCREMAIPPLVKVADCPTVSVWRVGP